MNLLGPKPRREYGVGEDQEQQKRDELLQEARIDLLHRVGAEDGTYGGPEDPGGGIAQVHGPGLDEVRHGARRAEGGLELVGPQGVLRRQADPEEDRNGDEAAAACDGVDKTGNGAGKKQDRQENRGNLDHPFAPLGYLPVLMRWYISKLYRAIDTINGISLSGTVVSATPCAT